MTLNTIQELIEIEHGKKENVVVCITPQSNSKRLIDAGAEVAAKCQGSLHILHVQKGDSIFHNEETLRLLERLFRYGSQKGGMIHAFCDNDIPRCIAKFVSEEKITHVVIGELPKEMQKKAIKGKGENQFDKILKVLPQGTEIVIVKREEEQQEELQKKIG